MEVQSTFLAFGQVMKVLVIGTVTAKNGKGHFGDCVSFLQLYKCDKDITS